MLDDLPERHFAPDEVRDLRALPAADQARVFFDYWTLKEAYIKARGLGLALPLDQFAFALPPARRRPPLRAGFDDDAAPLAVLAGVADARSPPVPGRRTRRRRPAGALHACAPTQLAP